MNARTAAKLHVPEPGRQEMLRPRCLELLQRESYRPLLALVSPPGYGKTTLLGCRARQLVSGTAVGWLTLDAEDNRPHQLLAHLALALPLADGDASRRLSKQAKETEEALQSDFPQAFLDTLIQSLNALEEVHLFFDQYEAIREAAVHRIFEYLIAYSGKRVHYYIASRHTLAFYPNIHRLRPGPIEISCEQLKLDSDELIDWIRRRTPLQPQADWILQLEQRTEGWPLAVERFVSLWDGSRPNPSSEEAAIDTVESQLHDVLTDELRRQQEPLQQFMLQTSVPDSFNDELGCWLAEDTAYSRHIERLLECSLLSRDANRQYRYHPMLARNMRERLRLLDKSRFLHLQERSISWYVRNGHMVDAVRHALRIPDYERASELLLQDVAATFSCPKPVLIQLLAQFPSLEISSRPSVAMIYAWFLTAEHRIATAETVLDQAEMRMTEDFCPFPPTGEDLRGYIASIRSRIHFLRRDAERGMALMIETEARLHGPGYLYSHFNTLDPAGSSLLKSDAGHWGAIEQTLAMCEYAEPAWKGVNQGYGIIHVMLGECHYERNRLDQAETHLLKGRGIGLDLMDMGLIMPASLALVQLKHDRGEVQGAQILLQETRQLAAKEDVKRAQAVIEACQARLDMKSHRQADVRRWLRSQPVEPKHELNMHHMYEYLTLLRTHVFLKHIGQGIHFGEKLLISCESRHLHAHVAEIGLLLAVLYEYNGERNTALRKLEHALEVGQREGYVRLFLTEWDIAEPILRKYEKQRHAKNTVPSPGASPFYNELLRLRAEQELAADKHQYARKLLTPKEYKVLQCLIAGKSNAAIAEAQSIQIETVKTHCQNIYKKLRLKSRKDVMRYYAEN